jgi:hypothetical protein
MESLQRWPDDRPVKGVNGTATIDFRVSSSRQPHLFLATYQLSTRNRIVGLYRNLSRLTTHIFRAENSIPFLGNVPGSMSAVQAAYKAAYLTNLCQSSRWLCSIRRWVP